MAGPAEVWLGTSGYVYRHWRKGVFYPSGLPAREELAYYASRFRTVELNNPFYRLPTAEMFQRWRDTTPPDFQFAVKASRYITHIKRLRDVAMSSRCSWSEPIIWAQAGTHPVPAPPDQQLDLARLDDFSAAHPDPPLGAGVPAPELAHPRRIPAADRSGGRTLHSGRRRAPPRSGHHGAVHLHPDASGPGAGRRLHRRGADLLGRADPGLRVPARRCTSTSTTTGADMRYAMRSS